jgi:hypothetical protein
VQKKHNISAIVDEKTRVSITCARLTKKIIGEWDEKIPYKFVNRKALLYDKDNVKVYLEALSQVGKFQFLLVENQQTKQSGVFSIAKPSCFWYSRY